MEWSRRRGVRRVCCCCCFSDWGLLNPHSTLTGKLLQQLCMAGDGQFSSKVAKIDEVAKKPASNRAAACCGNVWMQLHKLAQSLASCLIDMICHLSITFCWRPELTGAWLDVYLSKAADKLFSFALTGFTLSVCLSLWISCGLRLLYIHLSPGTQLVFHAHTPTHTRMHVDTHTQSAQCLWGRDDRDLQPGSPLSSGVRKE